MKRFLNTLLVAVALVSPAAMAQNKTPTTLPPVVVTGSEPGALGEEQRVGAYDQPEWTFHRRFSTTRVYVQKEPWEFGFEQWWRGRFNRNHTQSHRFQEEVEVGLPYRMQFDLYENWTSDQNARMQHHSVATELRWALADWGKIPLNPTLYGEWQFVDPNRGPDKYEVKLLLGEELGRGWHWGFNGILEQEVGGGRATEWGWSQGISYTVRDQRLSVGAEMRFNHETSRGARSNPAIQFLAGPSVQWRPFARAHLDLVPLAGLTTASPRLETFLILTIDLGTKGDKRYAPASLRGR